MKPVSTLRKCSITIIVVLAVCVALPSCMAQTPAPLFKGTEAVPADATILFDGTDMSKWTSGNSGGAPEWKIENGYAQAKGRSIRTKDSFGDCQLHVEFWLPLMADQKGQYRANSGVYLNNLYEVQVLDSYGLKSAADDCGSIYSITAPSVNACRPPETWQTFDILFHAAKFDASGKKTANARISVLHNGVWIHDNVEIPYPTANHEAAETAKGPVQLQFHGNPIRYRNVWIRPL